MAGRYGAEMTVPDWHKAAGLRPVRQPAGRFPSPEADEVIQLIRAEPSKEEGYPARWCGRSMSRVDSAASMSICACRQAMTLPLAGAATRPQARSSKKPTRATRAPGRGAAHRFAARKYCGTLVLIK
jgi:hypothetical protein